MDLTTLWAFLVTAITSILITFLTKRSLASGWKVLIAMVASIVIGIVTVVVQGDFAWAWPTVITVFGFSQAFFWIVIKGVPGLYDWLADHGIKDPTPTQ